MSDYTNFLSNVERRNDDLRLAEQSRRGEYALAGPILVEQLVKLLSTVRRSMQVWRPIMPKKGWAFSFKPFSHAGGAAHRIK
jgi:hypothetical protein